MDFSIEIVFAIIGYLISALLYWGFSKFFKKHPCKINLKKGLPGFLVVIFCVFNILLLAFFLRI